MNYAKIGIFTGIILIAISLLGKFISGTESMTVFIPAFVGGPILLSSLLALNPKMLKLGMHISALFGLLGFLAAAMPVTKQLVKGEFVWKLSTYLMVSMIFVCGVFVVLCIKSFIDARKLKKAQAA